MRGKRVNLSVVLPVFLLLTWSGCAQAFSFCFSFGNRDNHRTRYHNHDYLPPLPGGMPGLYGGYPYSPAPVYPGYGAYYSLPYGMPAEEPAPDTRAPATDRE